MSCRGGCCLPHRNVPAPGTELHFFPRHGQVGEFAARLVRTVRALCCQVLRSNFCTQSFQFRLVIYLSRNARAGDQQVALRHSRTRSRHRPSVRRAPVPPTPGTATARNCFGGFCSPSALPRSSEHLGSRHPAAPGGGGDRAASPSRQDVKSCAQGESKHPTILLTRKGAASRGASNPPLGQAVRQRCQSDALTEETLGGERREENPPKVTYVFKFLDVVVGEDVSFLEIDVGIQWLSHQGLPEGGQEVKRQRNVRSNRDTQELPKEMEQLLLRVGDGAGRQDVLPLQGTNRTGHTNPLLTTNAFAAGPRGNPPVKIPAWTL